MQPGAVRNGRWLNCCRLIISVLQGDRSIIQKSHCSAHELSGTRMTFEIIHWNHKYEHPATEPHCQHWTLPLGMSNWKLLLSIQYWEVLYRAPVVGCVPDKETYGRRDTASLPEGLECCGAQEAEALQASLGMEQGCPMFLPSLCSGRGVKDGGSFLVIASFFQSTLSAGQRL